MVGGIFHHSANIARNVNMDSGGSELRDAFVEAYPVYVVGVIESRGLTMSTLVADAIVEGAQPRSRSDLTQSAHMLGWQILAAAIAGGNESKLFVQRLDGSLALRV